MCENPECAAIAKRLHEIELWRTIFQGDITSLNLENERLIEEVKDAERSAQILRKSILKIVNMSMDGFLEEEMEEEGAL